MAMIKVAIDRGGTFTDVVATVSGQKPYIFKLLSVDPQNYEDANIEAIRRVLEHFTHKSISRNQLLDTSIIEEVRLGTTVATNALLERKGARCAFLTTKGFKDSLIIGNQTRPNIFKLKIEKPGVLYDVVEEIDERLVISTNNSIESAKAPSMSQILEVLTKLRALGIRSIAISFVHSYVFPDHERMVAKVARETGWFDHVTLSSDISAMIKYVPRANSSVADAYLTPEITKYVENFAKGLLYGLWTPGNPQGLKCKFMQSDGALTDAKSFSGVRAILSGPAAGVIAISKSCFGPERVPVVGLDVGGTSTDCCRFAGDLEHILETTTAGVTLQTPQLDINTIASGGGSRLIFENGLMRVGPESSGAHPGPVCYRKNGYLAITDANLILGRLVPSFFPKIFGPNEDEPLDIDGSRRAFQELAQTISKESGRDLTVEEVAEGFLDVANEAMARPIRTLTESRGHSVTDHRLASFGGAGGQCCCFVAFDKLKMKSVVIHRYSSVLSSYGLALADLGSDSSVPCSQLLSDAEKFPELVKKMGELEQKNTLTLEKQGWRGPVKVERFLNLRYQGAESAIMIAGNSEDPQEFVKKFEKTHLQEFGFNLQKPILVDDVRVRVTGGSEVVEDSIDSQLAKWSDKKVAVSRSSALLVQKTYFKGRYYDTAVFEWDSLALGNVVEGPAIILDGMQTNVVPPGYKATVLHTFLYISPEDSGTAQVADGNSVKSSARANDTILLSILAHRFIDVAEQMGYQLQKTSVSTNVKERLDFSCALFDKNSNLIASAPHIPVHLGSMSTFVKYQSRKWKGKLSKGDVVVGNHPVCGTHLPDITVMTPFFKDDSTENEPVFYLASRAHHSDIGSILPGSMPPNSKELWQEGAIIVSELLVKDHKFQEARMVELLFDEPSRFPGCSGTRKLSDNLNDLKAQVAANQRGCNLLQELIAEHGVQTIVGGMASIMDTAFAAVSAFLQKLAPARLASSDKMDDGSVIQVEIDIYENGTAKIDFSGSAAQSYSNLNAPLAVTRSALIYCLRCLVDQDIPLNEGFLRGIDLVVPKNSILNPGENSAVVAGNVLTSQRVTDVIFKAFGVMADSQGCTNNFTFGANSTSSSGFGYYETIAGGHGAGPTWHGADAVHTNMTNTKMTDVEIFEKNYPVVLRKFVVRLDSGGQGKFRGGNGVIREIEFKEPLIASILSERRVLEPKGLNGGGNGKCGQNLWVKRDGTVINLGGKNSVNVSRGDKIVIKTPGGGGYGAANVEDCGLGSVGDKLEESATGSSGRAKPKPPVATGSVYRRHETQYSN